MDAVSKPKIKELLSVTGCIKGAVSILANLQSGKVLNFG